MSSSFVRVACLVVLSVFGSAAFSKENSAPSYDELRGGFAKPDHARWGEVPLWWWEGDRMTRERVTWQLETLSAQGVKSICPIQRSPGRCDPQSFTPEWWDLFAFVHSECRRLGMTLWAYDQVGYGNYGWLEKAAAKAQDTRTAQIKFITADATAEKEIRLDLPDGKLIGARAYPIHNGLADDAKSVNLKSSVTGRTLRWTPPAGTWRVAVSVAVPYLSFHLSDKAADTFIDMFYGKFERRLGKDAMGTSFVGVFQDEHPPVPRDIYTERLANGFRRRCGYDIARAIPALHFDIGSRTPRYRTDFFDAYIDLTEQCYWKRVFDWTNKRNILTSHDNWGRRNINGQSYAYMDYFRAQRWFSAPGNDDSSQRPIEARNYYDTKIAASIAHLYRRPRVWLEGFHSSGWGRTTDQTLSWLSANYAFGSNIYDEHGLYYSTRAGTWEHAAPDPHFRQPYWRYYRHLSDWVARMSYLMSQGTHVGDAAVHYPAVSLLAGEPPNAKAPDYNAYMKLSRVLYDAGIDNDIADDESIITGTVSDGALTAGGNDYHGLVFSSETTIRRSVLEQALKLAKSGGTVVFVGGMPSATAEGGRGDRQLTDILKKLLDTEPANIVLDKPTTKSFPKGGFAAFVPQKAQSKLPGLVTAHIERDFVPKGGKVYVNHRRIGNVNAYLIQNVESHPIDLTATCRVDGVPEIWDAFTGSVSSPDKFERNAGRTIVQHRLEGNTAYLMIFRPGSARSGGSGIAKSKPTRKPIADEWTFSVIPTRDNLWGEFRWPPSKDVIGPEVRAFHYAEETGTPGTELGWHKPEFDHKSWPTARYSIGPYWLTLGPIPNQDDVAKKLLADPDKIKANATYPIGDKTLTWKNVEFSKTIGLARPMPWGGHSGYPDGAVDRNFIELAKGRKILFTRIGSPKAQRLGLRVELRNSKPRLWVNDVEQPFEDAIGNLPLKAGENTVLLDIPDGGKGRLFVQKQPPSVQSLDQAAQGMVTPDLRKASWIWSGNTTACYLRKTFDLKERPSQARVIVTADNGFRLFINGVKIEEEIGPWAKWQFPEQFNITPHLRAGRNVVAAWCQNLGAEAGFALALKARLGDGREVAIHTDETWKGSIAEFPEWQNADFDAAAWKPVTVYGKMGIPPWGLTAIKNIGTVAEPLRRLAIDLPTPTLTCFDEVPDIVYDVKARAEQRIGWFRFTAPAGLRRLTLPTTAKAQVWADGHPADVRGGVAYFSDPPESLFTVAIRVEMRPGSYAGAVFGLPLGMSLEGGKIRTGPWAEYALPTYSGIGVYSQNVNFTADELKGRTVLDLGKVLVAAEVLVNGKSVGVRLAAPFKFDLTKLLHAGENTLDVRVANTIAPHYTVTNKVANLGPTESGLIGPVSLDLYPR